MQQVQSSDETILERILADLNDGMAQSAVARKYGRSLRGIQTICAKYGIVRPLSERAKPGPKTIARAPISQQHRLIGQAIYCHRCLRGHSPSELGEILMVSCHRLRAMEVGIHDFSLSELHNIAWLLNTTVTELLSRK